MREQSSALAFGQYIRLGVATRFATSYKPSLSPPSRCFDASKKIQLDLGFSKDMQAGRGQVVSEHCKHTGCKLFRTPRHSQLSQRSTLRQSAQQSTSQPQRARPAQLAATASASDESSHPDPQPALRQSFPAWSAAALTAAVPVAGLAAAALPAHAEDGSGGGSNHNGGNGGNGGGDGQPGSDGRSQRHLYDLADDDDDETGGLRHISGIACVLQQLHPE